MSSPATWFVCIGNNFTNMPRSHDCRGGLSRPFLR